jgi:signal transduction histidine kinase
VFYYRAHHRFTPLETRVAAALGNLAAAALQTSELYQRETELRQRAQAEERKASFLAQAGELLSSSLDYEATLTAVVDLAVPKFADWASIHILEPTGEVRRVSVKHFDPQKSELADEYVRRFPRRDTDLSAIAMRSGKSVLIEELSPRMLEENARDAEHLRFVLELGLKSVIVAPLMAGARKFGYLSFVTAESGRRYTAADQALADELARRAATAIDNAWLYQESRLARQALEHTNAELQRLNEDLNQFAFSASHDLKEPLRTVAIYAQMLERKYQGNLDSDTQQYLVHILSGIKRMDMLLHDLLAYTKTMDVRPALRPEPVDLSDVARKVLAGLSPLASETGACVVIEELPSLRVQELHFWQLLQNLLENALKYRSRDAPAIEIGAALMNTVWTFWVKDNGIGVPPEFAQQIFGRFKRLHSSDQYEGTGLGLAICKRIVERYDGRIWVESDGVKGSKFLFTLPAGQ